MMWCQTDSNSYVQTKIGIPTAPHMEHLQNLYLVIMFLFLC